MIRCLVVVSLLSIVLSACTPQVVRGPGDEASPHLSLPVGTTLILHREVFIAPTYARVFFQSGDAGPAINEFLPHCQLEVRQVLPVPQTIAPDEFVITKVGFDIMDVVAIPGLRLADGGDGGVSDIMEAWKMQVHSDRQPNVLFLICAGAIDNPGRARPPSVRQIRQAFGAYGSIELPN